jgi:UPF0755 protein
LNINLKKLKSRQAIAITAIAFVLLIFIPVYYSAFIPVYIGNTPVKFTIKEGQSLKTVAQGLKERELIRNEFIFNTYVKLSGNDKNLKAGTYTLGGRLDMPDIVFVLVNGLAESDDIRLLISEGFNIWEIDERLADLDLIEEGDFSSQYHDQEGYMFPDTYRINRRAAGPDFIHELKQRMSDNFNAKTAELLGHLSPAEEERIIIVASILEKEARSERDMKLVSGIIKRRMELGMLLQVDATVLYGACLRDAGTNNWSKNCNVSLKGPALEIKVDGPFNTYIREGLPPSPISNPGLRAIEAALNPTESDYLYYLTPRGTSDIVYARTAVEHVANRKKYLGI